MPVLADLLEKRKSAAEAYEAHTSPIISESRDFTPDEDAKRIALRAEVVKLDERIAEVDEEERGAAKAAEVQARLAAAEGRGREQGGAIVRSEPRVYGEGSGHSYFADFVRASDPRFPGHRAAQERQASYSKEISVEIRDRSTEGLRAMRLIRHANQENEGAARSFEREFETRAMDTTSASGGAFVPPAYLESDWATWRGFGRAFADAANKQDLPEYGITVYLPHITGPAGVANQGANNTAVTETDPSAGYLSSNLDTMAGQIVVAQQLLDRSAPGVNFDKVCFQQLTTDYNQNLDAAAIAAAIQVGGSVAGMASPSVGGFYGDVGKAASVMETTPGTVVSPTHLFASAAEWNWLSTQLDANDRPLIVPARSNPMNAIAGGGSAPAPFGDTGYEVLGQRVFKDTNIPTVAGSGQTPPTNTQLISAYMPEVWLWEGPLVPRIIPQTYAQNLSVLLQLYSYWTMIVRYPNAVQVITGNGYPAVPTFA